MIGVFDKYVTQWKAKLHHLSALKDDLDTQTIMTTVIYRVNLIYNIRIKENNIELEKTPTNEWKHF